MGEAWVGAGRWKSEEVLWNQSHPTFLENIGANCSQQWPQLPHLPGPTSVFRCDLRLLPTRVRVYYPTLESVLAFGLFCPMEYGRRKGVPVLDLGLQTHIACPYLFCLEPHLATRKTGCCGMRHVASHPAGEEPASWHVMTADAGGSPAKSRKLTSWAQPKLLTLRILNPIHVF